MVAFAPGRVNLIGEHTDYNDGFVFPVAIGRGVAVAMSLSDERSECVSWEFGTGPSFDVSRLSPNTDLGWSAYIAGVAWALGLQGAVLPNVRVGVTSNLPIGASLSSSAAIEVASILCWEKLAGIDLDPMLVCELGRTCENGFVEVQSGVMDQLVSVFGRKGCALFIDTRSKEIDYVPLPEDLRIVICDTQVTRSLQNSAYNERREQCRAACAALRVNSLREVGPEQVETLQDPTLRSRARHVVNENLRCREFRGALLEGDRVAIGSLMSKSHISLRDDYAVSCRELDAMVEACWGAQGCVGARMTGAGFGGAAVALVDSNLLEPFLKSVELNYREATGIAARLIVCQAGSGARIVSEPLER